MPYTVQRLAFLSILALLQVWCYSAPSEAWPEIYEIQPHFIAADTSNLDPPILALISAVSNRYKPSQTEVLTTSEIPVNKHNVVHSSDLSESVNAKGRSSRNYEAKGPNYYQMDKDARLSAAFGKNILSNKGSGKDDGGHKELMDSEDINDSSISLYGPTAKFVYATGGVVLLGVTGYRYLRNYFLKKEMEKYIRDPTPFTELLNHVLLKMDPITKKPVKVATADVLQNDTVIALLFTGKGIEDIIQKNGFSPLFPQIKKLYEEHQRNGKKLEIVYISLDKSAKDSLKHFQDMPWYALPFEDWKAKRTLINEFNVKRFPAIVTLNGDGSVSNAKAYTAMLSAPQDYPWKPQSIESLLQRGLINNKNVTVDPATVKGKVIGLYFSANWCPPCREFTPKLAEAYKTLKEQKADFEIVFISNDETEEKFHEYFGKHMPWLAIPYWDVTARALIQDQLEVSTLPRFVLLDENYRILNANARKAVEVDSAVENFPWIAKPVEELADSTDGLYENPSFIIFMEEASESTQKQIQKDLLDVAKRIERQNNGKRLSFFTVSSSTPQSVGLRRLFKLPILTTTTGDSTTKRSGMQPRLVALDLPNRCYYKMQSDEITMESIASFVEAFQNNKLAESREMIVLPSKKMKQR